MFELKNYKLFKDLIINDFTLLVGEACLDVLNEFEAEVLLDGINDANLLVLDEEAVI